MEISVLSTEQIKGGYITTYKYWIKGDCGCTAIKIQREFDKIPSLDDLIKAI